MPRVWRDEMSDHEGAAPSVGYGYCANTGTAGQDHCKMK